MSFSPLDNHEEDSPIANLPRVTMCLDKEFPDEFKEEFPEPPKSENMHVYARVRPMLQREEDEGYKECVSAIDDETVRAVVPINSAKFKNSGLNPQDTYDFKYTQAFGPDVGQFVFFENTIMDTMLGYIEGQNCLIFNYGITNSGKTYTLQGNEGNPGIIPLAMHMFFGCMESQLMEEICVKPEKCSDIVALNDSERTQEYRLKGELLRMIDNDSFNKTSGSDASVVGKGSKSFSQVLCECFRDDFKYQTDTTLPADEMIAAQSALYMREKCKTSVDDQLGKCNIWVSFIEIYNEYIYDLLQPNITQRQKLSLAEDQNGDVYVKGAREICVSNSMEAIKLMYVGRKNLRIASTKLNYQSSRSHCIFTVKTARVFEDEHGTSGTVNRICFCDLAGSERASKSQASGMRIKEAGYINNSLMVLGRCLDQLRRNQTAKDKKMIPFRESKLTRIFSNHFLGKGKAVMIANASPCEYTFDETLNVLRFSALAKNLAISDSYISMAHSSIATICDQWHKSKKRVSGVSLDESSDLDSSFAEELEERDQMIEKLVDLCESLKENLEKEKKEKRELEFKIKQDVCADYAAYADDLLDQQKKTFETEIDSLKEIYNQRYETMKDMYEKKIHELQADLDESDASFEHSINEANKTFEKMEQSLISFSPAFEQTSKEEVKEVAENVSVMVDTSMECFGANAGEDEKTNSDIQSLEEDLKSVTKELDVTKQKLEQTLKSLKESQTEGAISKEKCDTLNCKLLEANQVLEEYLKELEQLKRNCVLCQDEIDSLLGEKKDLQDNILSLSEQLAQSEAKAEQFKIEKLEIEENYSQKLAESERKIMDLGQKCGNLEELNIKYNELKEEYAMHKEVCSSTIEDFSILKEKFDAVSLQLAEAEKLNKEKIEVEEDFSQKLVENEKKIAELEEKCRELICKIEEAVQAKEELQKNYNNLEEEYNLLKDNSNSTSEDLKQLTEKFASKIGELAEAEKLKEEKLERENEFSQKMLESEKKIADLEEKCIELIAKIEEAVQAKEEAQKEYNGLEEEFNVHKSNTSSIVEDFRELKEKFASNLKELDLAASEIELLKKEKLGAETDFSAENLKLLEENNFVVEESKNLKLRLEAATKDLEERKLVINELETKIENLELVYASSKTDNSELLRKLENMEEQLSTITKELEEAKFDNGKSKELVVNLEEITLALKEEKDKVTELVKNCSEYEAENARLLKELKDSEEKLKLNIEQACNSQKVDNCESLDENSSVLETAKVAELELKIEELETSCATYKSKNSELKNDLNNLHEKCDIMCQDSKHASEKSTELRRELEKITEILKEEKSKTDELLSKCDNLETENAKLLKDIEAYKETSVSLKTDDTHSADIGEFKVKLEEMNQLLKDKQLKFDELEKEYCCMKNENTDLIKALNEEKEKFTKLSEEQALATSEIKHLQKEISEAVDIHSKALSELKMKETIAQEKLEELASKLEETSKIIEDQKIQISEAEEKSLKYENQKLELSEKFTALKEEYSSFSEIYGELLQILEKCELNATQKMKLLHSSSIKNLDQLADLNRHVREKETSIEELEKALCDCQKQLKDSEAKAKKQMHALNQQHSIEVEELSHLKKLLEEENVQLKSTVSELKKLEEAKKEEVENNIQEDEKKEETVKRSSKASKDRKKRSLSEVSKDEFDNSQDKENSDREIIKEKITEEKGASKRRRVLRQRQEIAVVSSNSDTEDEASRSNIKKKVVDEDFKPKATTRRRAPNREQSRQKQKKTVVEEPKVSATTARPSRRKLQEENENVSPVKKAMAFVGSKIRSVAQTVSSMPSPRITRGRRKLFNAEAASPLERKWKI